MLLFSFAVEKVKMIYQCVTSLDTLLGHSLCSLCGCPSISVRPQRKYIFEMSYTFCSLIRLQLFFVVRRLFCPQNLSTGTSSSDMSDTFSPQDFGLKYSHCHHRNHLYYPHIQSHYPESSP